MVDSITRAPFKRFDGWRDHAPDGRLLWVDVTAQRLWVLERFEATLAMRCSTAAAGLGEREGSFRTPRGWHAVSARIGDRLPEGAILEGRRWTGRRWTLEAEASADTGADASADAEAEVEAEAHARPTAATPADTGLELDGPVAGPAASAALDDAAPGPPTGGTSVAVDEDLILTRVLWLEGREPGRNRGGDVDTRRRFIYIHGTNQPGSLGQPASHGCVRVSCRDVIRLHDHVQVGHPVWIG